MKTSWRRWCLNSVLKTNGGGSDQGEKKGKQDGVRASLPSRIIFLQGGLGKQGHVTAVPESPINLQLTSQCSSWLLPAPPWLPAHHQNPRRSGPINVRLLLGASWRWATFPFLLPSSHSYHGDLLECGRHCCRVDGTWWEWQSRWKYSKFCKGWLFSVSARMPTLKGTQKGFLSLTPFLKVHSSLFLGGAAIPSFLEPSIGYSPHLNSTSLQTVGVDPLPPVQSEPTPTQHSFTWTNSQRQNRLGFSLCGTLCTASWLPLQIGLHFLCRTLQSSQFFCL